LPNWLDDVKYHLMTWNITKLCYCIVEWNGNCGIVI